MSWLSPELQLEMSGRTEDSEGEVVERRLSNISRAEPPADLFEGPARDKTAMTLLETLWLNPRVPEILSPRRAAHLQLLGRDLRRSDF